MNSGSILMLGNGQSNLLSPGSILGTGNGIIAIDGSRFRFGVGLVLTFQPGVAGTATVLVSGDKVDQNTPINWNPHDVLFNLTGARNSNLAYPVTAVALLISGFVTSNSNNGINLSVVQVRG